MGAHAAAHRRMPPMLDIAFAKLMRGGTEKMLTDQGRLGVHQCHHVLQLIAEAIRTTGLIKARAPPEAKSCFAFLPIGKIESDLHRTARIQTGTRFSGKSRPL